MAARKRKGKKGPPTPPKAAIVAKELPPGLVRPWEKACKLDDICGYLKEVSDYLADLRAWIIWYHDLSGGDKTAPPPPPTWP